MGVSDQNTVNYDASLCELYHSAVSIPGLDEESFSEPEGYHEWLKKKMADEVIQDRLDEYAKKLMNGEITEEEYLREITRLGERDMASALELAIASLGSIHGKMFSSRDDKMNTIKSHHQKAFDVEDQFYQEQLAAWTQKKQAAQSGVNSSSEGKSGGFWPFGKKNGTDVVDAGDAPKKPLSFAERIEKDRDIQGIRKDAELIDERASSASASIRRLQQFVLQEQPIHGELVDAAASYMHIQSLPGSFDTYAKNIEEIAIKSGNSTFTPTSSDAEKVVNAMIFAQSYFDEKQPKTEDESDFLNNLKLSLQRMSDGQQGDGMVERFIAWIESLRPNTSNSQEM